MEIRKTLFQYVFFLSHPFRKNATFTSYELWIEPFMRSNILLSCFLSRVYIFRNEDCISENIDRESSFKSLRKYFNHSLLLLQIYKYPFDFMPRFSSRNRVKRFTVSTITDPLHTFSYISPKQTKQFPLSTNNKNLSVYAENFYAFLHIAAAILFKSARYRFTRLVRKRVDLISIRRL